MIQWAIFKIIEAAWSKSENLVKGKKNLRLTKFSLFDQAASFGLNYFENRPVDHFKVFVSKFSL